MPVMIKTIAAVTALLAMTSCEPAPVDGNDMVKANASASAPVTTGHPPVPAPQFAAIATDTYAMTFTPGTPHPVVEAAIRQQCVGKQWCKVIGWDDPAFAATAMPMTDRESDAVKVNYTLNRASGMDQANWS